MNKPWEALPTPTMSGSFSDWEGIKVSTNPAKAVSFIMDRAKNLERRMRNAERLLSHYSMGSCPHERHRPRAGLSAVACGDKQGPIVGGPN